MLKTIICFTTGLLTIFSGCTENHLITDKDFRSEVTSSFTERKQLAHKRSNELFKVFDTGLSQVRREALEFLYAYMPLNDLADYEGDFFLANTDIALRSRTELSWGKEIPEDIFLHYVLPVRVNNENLDSFRIVYHDEIKQRIKGLDAVAAILEINHWCHEKVTYQPSDTRTSGPMGTILSERGRCGEQSTLTVAALRTAGIPARQVYVPRWAHCDDNHAWVEAWLNGKWYYMGGCEPEPVLDRGWFTEPARRAMLVHSNSFGAYYGNENAMARYSNYSDINNLSKYAETKNVFIKVMDIKNRPVRDAIIEYQLYNYAEFFPLASLTTDANGISRFETGLGDLMIWARKGDNFNFRKITVSDTDTLSLVLDRKAAGYDHLDLDLGVPAVRTPLEPPPAKMISDNESRISKENLIRQSYVDTWMKPGLAMSLARSIGADTNIVRDIISRSMGNFRSIYSFLLNAATDEKQLALKTLTLLSDKDLRDIKTVVLADHLENSIRYHDKKYVYDTVIYYNYVLNPRISDEIIVPWRKYLVTNLSADLRKKATDDPSIIISYINDRITIDDSDNYYKTPLTPRGVNELGVSDSHSRDIYFVAVCRSLGIPSRLEPGSKLPQYYFNKTWNDACFINEKILPEGKGFLRLISSETRPVPEYYIHFTIARFNNGRYNTLEYDKNKSIVDFKTELALTPGHYMLVTGNRLNDSKILSSISFFELGRNEHKVLNVNLRHNSAETR